MCKHALAFNDGVDFVYCQPLSPWTKAAVAEGDQILPLAATSYCAFHMFAVAIATASGSAPGITDDKPKARDEGGMKLALLSSLLLLSRLKLP